MSRSVADARREKRLFQARMLFEVAQCCGQIVGTNSLEVVLLNDEGSFRISKDEHGSLKMDKVTRPSWAGK